MVTSVLTSSASEPKSGMRADVLVAGGGIAGIAAALRLAEHGVRVTLVETRTKLGGRATSFQDVRTGEMIDNCQHVAMGCCTNYLDLCRRLGVDDKLEWINETYWVEAGGRTSVLARGVLPPPAHFSGGFLGLRFLSMGEKISLARVMFRLLRADRMQHQQETFSDWLTAQGQSGRIISRFWEPIVISACNLPSARVSASVAMHVFQEGFLSHRDAASIGLSRVPLVELYDAAEDRIHQAGGRVLLRTGVDRLEPNALITTRGERLEAEHVISALPFERLVRCVPPDLRDSDERLAQLSALSHSPILGVHLVLDRPLLRMHSAVLVDRPTQWIFRKNPSGSMIHAVISAADEWMNLTEDQITQCVMNDLQLCFPEAADARALSSRPVKEKRATFAPTPDAESLRPTTTGTSRLILAGDYVQTGWPATMEGATRSGYQAAAVVLGMSPESLVIPPLRPGGFARAIGGRSIRRQFTASGRRATETPSPSVRAKI